MKKIVVLFLLMILLIIPNFAKAQNISVYVFCNEKSQVNLRESPSQKSTRCAYALLGEEIEIDLEQEENGFYPTETITGECDKAYISGTYLSLTEPQFFEDYTLKTTSRVFIRESPNGDIIKKLKKGTQIIAVMMITDLSGVEWYKTQGGGYIMGKYLEEDY